ncbi:hypothetical protein LELG_04175 [Lodderomyces elongisporus NRRL YB-4239]|uniref:Zn(2)-C6 fungal-type domain-containing protein n=1 Tax=Lodderomyces elongisporus (strain ATCC 11503 / CBS 2605 / JCM 1781 / NBRC 1676 / NRRL YB-4239) TaxID=379508 RepID=A5E3I8_LODEL|nr:hypothetical protein LELG_04175 [Lodderomyces elongisporus NRRL YB-4239]
MSSHTQSASRLILSINNILSDTGQSSITGVPSNTPRNPVSNEPKNEPKNEQQQQHQHQHLLNGTRERAQGQSGAMPSTLHSNPAVVTPSSASEISHTDPRNADPPRKRSKISRACDACRKKKVKCNAEFSTTLNKVTKICNNCEKNVENCTFSRTPLKRGPSKGYTKDLEDRIDAINGKSESRLSSDGGSYNHHIQQNTSSGISPSRPDGLALDDGKNSHSSSNLTNLQNRPLSQSLSSLGGTIKLPPLMGYIPKSVPGIQGSGTINYEPDQLSPKNAQRPLLSSNYVQTQTQATPQAPSSQAPSSQAPSSQAPPPQQQQGQGQGNSNATSPPIQGPFWKVPYEMPPASTSHRSSIVNLSSSGQSHSRRKSSIDSITSNSTTNSRIPLVRTPSSAMLSDSDSEDFYSIRSGTSIASRPMFTRENSQSLSPRNSIVSLSSLNGRMNRSLHVGVPPQSPVGSSVVGSPYNFTPQPTQQQQIEFSKSNPHQFLSTPQIAQINPHQPHKLPMDLLKLDLEVYERTFAPTFPILQVSAETLISMIKSTGDEMPIENIVESFHLALNDLINFKTTEEYASISLFFRLQLIASQSKVNKYTRFIFAASLVVLNYTLLLKGVRYSPGIAMAAAFFGDLTPVEVYLQKKSLKEPLDPLLIAFVRLYLTLVIIDSVSSLVEGTTKLVTLDSTATTLILGNDKENNLLTMECPILKDELCLTNILNDRKHLCNRTNGYEIKDELHTLSPDVLCTHFTNIIRRKYAVYQLILNETASNINLSTLTARLDVLASTVMHFANYLSTTTISNKSVVHPYLCASVVQLFYVVAFTKRIISHMQPTDEVSKINHNLSISFNLLNLNLNNLQLSESKVRQIRDQLTRDKLDFSYTGQPAKDLGWLEEVKVAVQKDLMNGYK